MRFYGLFIQGAYLAVWLVVLIGAAIFLRTQRAGGAVTAMLGAAIHVFATMGSLLMMLLMTTGLLEAHFAARIMVFLGLPALLGGVLFAIGFLHLALAVTRERPHGSA